MGRVELRCLSGRTAFVDAEDVSALRDRVADLEGVPSDELRLTCGGRELHAASPTAASQLASSMPVHVLLRLVGGKGGFGAMLRTAGARGVKTTNFDACRDLNGRRLRHVNAEAALRQWEAQAEERKLKKQQRDALNAKPGGPPPIARFDDDEYEEMLEGARSRVSDALAAGLRTEDGSSSTDVLTAPAVPGLAATSDANSQAIAPASNGAPPSATALGKRKATAPIEANASACGSSRPSERVGPETAAPPPKASKLNVAYDPLAALGGADTDESGEEEGEEGDAEGGA